MPWPLTRPVTRQVTSLHFGQLVVTLAEEGVYLRQRGRRRSSAVLLPYGVAFQRATMLHLSRERAEKKAVRKGQKRK